MGNAIASTVNHFRLDYAKVEQAYNSHLQPVGRHKAKEQIPASKFFFITVIRTLHSSLIPGT